MDNNCGQHWLLLRGLARESAHWGDFIPQLQHQFPAATISALDLPGTGQFYQQNSPASIPKITEFVRQQALNQGLLKKPVTLLAISLGGMVAWEWLQQYPEDIAGAVLMNTSFANLSPFYQRLRWQSYRKLAYLFTQKNPQHRELAIIQLVCNRIECYQETAQKWAHIQSTRPLSLTTAGKQLIAAASYHPAPTPAKMPVLLLNGAGDRLVSPACSQAIQKHYALKLFSHPWAGHDLTLDDGDWVNAQLQAWLSSKNR